MQNFIQWEPLNINYWACIFRIVCFVFYIEKLTYSHEVISCITYNMSCLIVWINFQLSSKWIPIIWTSYGKSTSSKLCLTVSVFQLDFHSFMIAYRYFRKKIKITCHCLAVYLIHCFSWQWTMRISFVIVIYLTSKMLLFIVFICDVKFYVN